MSETNVTALGYLEIGATDLQAWRSYATDVLNVACAEAGDALLIRYDEICWRMRIVPTDADDIIAAGFELADEDALAALLERLDSLGFTAERASAQQADARGVDALAITHDPFGLRIELYIGARSASEPCALPHPGNGYVTGAQGLGHMVLTAADQTQAERFYMQGLGFRLSDHILLGPEGNQLQLTFLHCNPRHHTLALVPMPGPKRLHHIMLQVTTLDEVGHGLDRALRAGTPVTSSLGKHTNDQMVSFYMRTPSGFDVEYGYGGIEIDDATWQTGTHYATSFWGHRPPG